MRCKFVRTPLTEKSVQLIQFSEFLKNNAFQRAENRADCNYRAMSVTEKNWQTTKPTIKERSKHMFNNDLFSDVKFVVRGGSNGKSENKQAIPAHKFVLSISSPVFEAMFYGELVETGNTIELPDCEYDSLLELFRYTYSDEAILSGSNVMGMLYLAKKYIVPSLADKCTKYLQENLDPSNVFSILPSAQKYEEKNLVDQCWKVIDKQTEEAVKSDGFATIERSLLEAVVVRECCIWRILNPWCLYRLIKAEYVQEHLDPSNVFSILSCAQKYEEKNLVDQCWKVIDKQTEEAVKSDGFATIELKLEALAVRDTRSIKEINLFKAVNLWATNESERQSLKSDGEIKRRILGESIVKGIRFPLMKGDEFANIVLDSEILTPKEVIALFKYYNAALNSSLEFIVSVRSPLW